MVHRIPGLRAPTGSSVVTTDREGSYPGEEDKGALPLTALWCVLASYTTVTLLITSKPLCSCSSWCSLCSAHTGLLCFISDWLGFWLLFTLWGMLFSWPLAYYLPFLLSSQWLKGPQQP